MDERSDFASSGRASGPSEDASNTTMLDWDRGNRRYQCKDDAVLEAPKTTAIWYDKDENSEIPCEKLFIGNVRFSRDMREIIESEDAIRTITFPKTVRVVKQWVFFEN